MLLILTDLFANKKAGPHDNNCRLWHHDFQAGRVGGGGKWKNSQFSGGGGVDIGSISLLFNHSQLRGEWVAILGQIYLMCNIQSKVSKGFSTCIVYLVTCP